MTTEHKYAQVLRWIAEGKAVQIRVTAKESEWRPMFLSWHDSSYRHLIQGDLLLDYEFRIKPRTVKIGSREIEAPVLDPVAGQELWYWNYEHEETRQSRVPSMGKAHAGVYFASPEACRAAHEAWVALMRGEA